MSTDPQPPFDLKTALNGKARSRPTTPGEVVPPAMVPATPAVPVTIPTPAAAPVAPIAPTPVLPMEQPPVAKKEVASRRKKRKPDAEPGRKQTFAINETNDLMLEQAAFHTRKSKTYFVNKGLKLLLKQYPEALIPIPDDEDEEDDE